MNLHTELPDLHAETDHEFRLELPQLGRTIDCRPDETMLECARRHGVRILGACGGRGTCGSCEIRYADGSDDAGADGEPSWRRACRTYPERDATILVSPRSLVPVVHAAVRLTAADATGSGSAWAAGTGRGADLPAGADPLDPAVRQHEVELQAPTLDDPVSDMGRLARLLPIREDESDLALLRELPERLRQNRWKVRARVAGDRLIGVTAPATRGFGLAVDVGTTNLCAFLIELETGRETACLTIENPQAAWGADLISRIDHARRSREAATALSAAGLRAIEAVAADLCGALGATPDDIVDVTICCNTAIHHLLLGLPVAALGRTPFVSVLQGPTIVSARELGLPFCAGARIFFVPGIGGFVGGDHTSALLATRELWSGSHTTLVMDIGTNTEMTVVVGATMHTASCPSGPALEAGNLRYGMRAVEGAIQGLRYDDGELALRVIGDSTPIGLCGSGVLETMSVLHASGAVDRRGRIAAAHPLVRTLRGKRAAQLAPSVLFTQDDVRAVQLAKAAIRSATELLLRQVQLPMAAIDRFIIAGAFGAWIDLDACVDIGLLPDLPRDRFVQVGNAAGAGIRSMLVSAPTRRQAREIAGSARYVELSTIAEFQKVFLEHIGFPQPKQPSGSAA